MGVVDAKKSNSTLTARGNAPMGGLSNEEQRDRASERARNNVHVILKIPTGLPFEL